MYSKIMTFAQKSLEEPKAAVEELEKKQKKPGSSGVWGRINLVQGGPLPVLSMVVTAVIGVK